MNTPKRKNRNRSRDKVGNKLKSKVPTKYPKDNITVLPICDDITTPDLTMLQQKIANCLLCPYCANFTMAEIAKIAGTSKQNVQQNMKSYKFRKILFMLKEKIPEVYAVQIIAGFTLEAIVNHSLPHGQFLFEYTGQFIPTAKRIVQSELANIKSLTDKELEKIANDS